MSTHNPLTWSLTSHRSITLCLPVVAQKKGGDDFTDLIKRYYAAWITLNPDNPYARDADLVFFDIAPLRSHRARYTSRFCNEPSVMVGLLSGLRCLGDELFITIISCEYVGHIIHRLEAATEAELHYRVG